ncbi:hypothetical protein BFP78_10335 [Gaetbulibacter sp. 5U11]|nr:hypothetical protein BFP78_10335 [Gaetbulibacter sp. 5U11]
MKDNWEECLFEKETSLITKGTTPTSLGKEFKESGINFIKAESITNAGNFIPESFAFIDEETHEILKRSQLQVDDILFSIAGVLGRIAVVDKTIIPANTNQALALIRLSNSSILDRDYIKYYLNGAFIKDQIRRINVQAAQANFSLGDIGRLNIQYPPLLQQQKIAKILSTVDKVIEKTESAIAKYQAIKQGLMHDLFTRGIDVKTGKLRPTPKDAPELYKESIFGLIPRDWEEMTFGDEINFLSGCPFSSVFFNEEKRGMPLIRIRDLISSSQETYYNGVYSDSYLIKEGDVLIGMDGDFHIVKWKNSASLLNQRILKISEKKEGKLYLDYFFYYLFPFLLDVHNKTAATTVKHLSTKDISGATRFMPLKSEQILSAKKILSIDNKIQTEQQALAKYQQLKAGLLQDLLTGKVEVSVD